MLAVNPKKNLELFYHKCHRQESNLYLDVRSVLFYPLNYGGNGLNLRSTTYHRRHPKTNRANLLF